MGVVFYALFWAITFSGWYGLPFSATFTDDAGGYSLGALHLAQSGFYSIDGVNPFDEREPGYSFFLAPFYAAFGMNAYVVFIVQGILYIAAVCVFVWQLGKTMNRKVVAATFLLLATLVPVFHSIFSAYREWFTLILFLSFATLFLSFQRCQNWAKAAGLGLLLGWIILTYFSFLFLPIFLIALWPLQRLKWKFLPVILIIPALLIFGWAARNRVQVGKWEIVNASRTTVMWYVRGEQAEQVRGLEPLRCLWSEYVSRNWTGRSSACSFNGLMHAKWATPPQESDSDIARAGQRKILRNFPHYLWFSAVDIIELHLPFVGGGWSFAYNLLASISMFIVYVGCALGLTKIWRREYGLLILLPLYNMLVFILTDATPRYLIPVIFCYAVVAGTGYGTLRHRFKILAKLSP